jgi:DnaJ-class molecular chaperone
MSDKEYYRILGVEDDASQAAIKEAYRKLAFKYHPDRNKGDPAATEKMKEINEAYAVLANADKRREYDLLRSRYGTSAYDQFRQSHTAEDIFRGSDINQVFEEFARMFGFRSSADIFRGAYGPQYRRFVFYSGPTGSPGRPSQAGAPAGIRLPGFFGGLVRFLLKTFAGIELPERGRDRHDRLPLRPEVARDGAEIEYRYRKWGEARNLLVSVPAGIRNGQRIRLKGMGSPGKGGGERGDLYLEVRVKKPLIARFRELLGK